MSAIIVPIFFHRHEPSKCPSCEKTEDIKQTCRHCGYEYQESGGLSFGMALAMTLVSLILLGVLGALWWMVSDMAGWALEKSAIILAGLIFIILTLSGLVYLIAGNHREWMAGKEKRG